MKYILGIVTVLIFSVSFFSCERWTENSNTLLIDTLVEDSMPQGFAAHTSKLQLLVQNDSSFFRGKTLGADKIAVTEPSLTKVEEDGNSITYTISLEATEEADIIYAFDTKDQLSAIDVVFYPKNDTSLQAFKTELIDYYSKKLNGIVSTKNNKSVLIGTDANTGIEWTEEGNAQIKDLHMHIFKLSS
ncbi:MAG: hypothetical protein H7259_02120, partial [Cytophagales bacterium]|nr:hypothetical protein [Cytophaga sp.]